MYDERKSEGFPPDMRRALGRSTRAKTAASEYGSGEAVMYTRERRLADAFKTAPSSREKFDEKVVQRDVGREALQEATKGSGLGLRSIRRLFTRSSKPPALNDSSMERSGLESASGAGRASPSSTTSSVAQEFGRRLLANPRSELSADDRLALNALVDERTDEAFQALQAIGMHIINDDHSLQADARQDRLQFIVDSIISWPEAQARPALEGLRTAVTETKRWGSATKDNRKREAEIVEKAWNSLDS